MQFSVTWLCQRFDVTPSGYYAWRACEVSDHANQDRRLTTETIRLFARHHERYGSPRLHRALIDAGWTVSRRRVARLKAPPGCGPNRCAGIARRPLCINGMPGIRTYNRTRLHSSLNYTSPFTFERAVE